MKNNNFCIYFIECSGGGIYIGVTADLHDRYDKHVKGRGALYTKTHPPVQLLATKEFPSRALAMREEKQLKKLSSDRKWEIVMKLMEGQKTNEISP